MKYVILGHENPDVDSIVSGYILEKIMRNRSYDVEYIVPDDYVAIDTVKLLKKYNLDVNKFKKNINKDDVDGYILVDHHERTELNKIIAIIDHHPTINNYSNNLYYKNEFASSTAILIALDCIDELDKEDIKLVCLATLIDTASFNSTKTRESDISWVKNMCQKYGFDYEKLYWDGLCLTDMVDINNSVFNGLKKYVFFNNNIHSSYIQVESLKNYEDIVNKCLDLLKDYVIKNNIDLFVFIVYDMTCFYTKVFKINKNDIFCDEYDKYASRGSTIIPKLEMEFMERNKRSC